MTIEPETKFALILAALMLALFVLLNFLVFPASSEELCLDSAQAVREASPGAWPTWGLRVPGHEGHRCWFPGVGRRAQDRRAVAESVSSAHRRVGSIPAMRNIPIPRDRLGSGAPIDEEDKQRQLDELFPLNRIEDVFTAVGWR